MERIVVATPKSFINVYVPPLPKTLSAKEISPIKSPILADFTTTRIPAGISSNANNICVSKDQTDESVIAPLFLSKLFEKKGFFGYTSRNEKNTVDALSRDFVSDPCGSGGNE